MTGAAQRDLRDTAAFKEAGELLRRWRGVGSGKISDATDLQVSPDGSKAVFTGTIIESLEGAPGSRICEVDLQKGDVRVLTQGPHNDRSAKYSPDGRSIAF